MLRNGLGVENLEARVNLSSVVAAVAVPGMLAGASASAGAVNRAALIRVGSALPASLAAPRPTASGVQAAKVAADLSTPPRRYRNGGWAVSTDDAKQKYFDAISHQNQNDLVVPDNIPVTPVTPTTPVSPTIPIATPTHEIDTLLPGTQISMKVTPTTTGVTLSGPLKGLTWSDVPSGTTNLTPMLWAASWSAPAALARQSLDAPQGMAGVFVWDLVNDLLTNPQDCCRTADGKLTSNRGIWMDNGIATVKARLDAYFSQYKAAGGRMDYMILDFEGGVSNFQLTAADAQAVQNDPRSAAVLKSLGLTNMTDVMNMKTGEYMKFDNAMLDKVNAGLNAAVFDVAKKYFPNVISSNYASAAYTQTNVAPDLNGHLFIPLTHPGTTNSPSLYGHIDAMKYLEFAPGAGAYGDSKMAVLRWEVNTERAANLATPDGVLPWIAFQAFTESSFTNNGYYQEMIYQAALSGATNFLVWDPKPASGSQNAAGLADNNQIKQLDATLSELNARLGTGTRTVVTPDQMAYDSNLVVSGVQLGNDKVLWRVSVPEGTKQVKVAETGQIITLNGAAGAWFESTPGQSVTFVAVK